MSNISDTFLITGSANPKLAGKIGEILKVDVSSPVSKFADSEIRVRISGDPGGKDVFIIQSTSNPVNDHILELLLMIDACKRSSARKITAVIPYFGYSRQDRLESPGVPISDSLVVRLLETAGVDRLVTVDIHSDQQLGFSQKPWDNLYGGSVLVEKIKQEKLTDVVVVSPDKGGVQRATIFSGLLGVETEAFVYKERDINKEDYSEVLDLVGNVKDKNVVIVDDIVDSGLTLTNAAYLLKKKGAKRIMAAVTHGVFSGQASRLISESPIEKLFITDTISQRQLGLVKNKLQIVSVASLIAGAIKRISEIK